MNVKVDKGGGRDMLEGVERTMSQKLNNYAASQKMFTFYVSIISPRASIKYKVFIIMLS